MQIEVNNLQASLTQVKLELTEAKAKASSSSDVPAAAPTPSNSKEVEDLRQQIAALQEALKESQAIAERAKEEAAAANAKAAAAGEGKADGASADGKKFTDDDIKGMVTDIYQLATRGFITEDEMNSIEDEKLKTHTIQLIKSSLKRLREILKQVSMEKLG